MTNGERMIWAAAYASHWEAEMHIGILAPLPIRISRSVESADAALNALRQAARPGTVAAEVLELEVGYR